MNGKQVKVTFLGDVMCQGPMLGAYAAPGGTYDFSPVFEGVRGLLAGSDLVVANLETPIAPDNRDLTRELYSFCSPIEFAEAVKAAGIGFVFTANNHCLDRGAGGVARTLRALDRVGLAHTGTFATAQEAEAPAVVDVKGFRIGLMSYTYGTNAFANGNYLDDANRFLVNLFQEQELANPLARAWAADRDSEEGRRYEAFERNNRPENLTLPVYERQEPHERERAALRADATRMKTAKPDFIALGMHAGGQYNPAVTKYTRELADFIASCGIDWIVGSHEHVVHGGDFSGFGGGKLAAFSLGNFCGLNGVWEPPMDKRSAYSIAWHLYLDRLDDGTPVAARTTFSVLKTVRDGGGARIRTVPAADLLAGLPEGQEKESLRAEILAAARDFCGADCEEAGVLPEYPLCDRSPVAVDKGLPAGNIAVERIAGDTVYLHQEMRDTEGPWFYWAFRVRGAAGRTLRFRFTQFVGVGAFGPCVSPDRGRTWRRTAGEGATPKSFFSAFPADADEVWFCQTVPYMQADWEAFLVRHGADRGRLFETGVLCRSRKGRAVEKALFGDLSGSPVHRIFLSARHHCGETMASYVLEGILESVLAQDDTGEWLRANVEFMVVPFVDKDGCEDGDQGKNRRPHDHNRDYTEFLYPETRGIRDWIAERARGRLDILFDFHCPWLYGDGNEYAYQVHEADPALAETTIRFGKILESVQSGSMAYREADDIRWGVDWNNAKNYAAGRSVKQWAHDALRCDFVGSLEIPFSSAHGNEVTPASCREFGRDIARAFQRFLEAPER